MFRRRISLATLAAMMLTVASVAGVGAGEVGDEEAESGLNREITLRLILRGPVVATDSFGIGGNFLNPASGADLDVLEGRHGLVCGPPGDFYADQEFIEPCVARTYETVFALPVEEAAEFTIGRDPNINDGPDASAVIYSVTVPATATFANLTEGDRSPQTFTLVYDYALSSLPNTAMPTP